MQKFEKYVEAVVKEVERSDGGLPPDDGRGDKTINTLYFGGGTPSLLPIHSLQKIITTIHKTFNIATEVECTIEGNPEQLTLAYLKDLNSLGFNRISIGVQSFNDDILHFLGRTHSGKDAFHAIENAQIAGFENISIDLMYGIYMRSLQDWKNELKTVFQLPVKHLSAYSLTVEENTLLHKKIAQQKILQIDEYRSLQELRLLMDETEIAGFEHYEVSNFALRGYHSKHNSNYWNGTPYVGFGASAHSFTGATRSWNISNVEKYMQAIEGKGPFFETEYLTPVDQRNEFILLGLRTKSGIDLACFESRFGTDKMNELLKALEKIDPKYYHHHNHHIAITKEGLPLLDFITAQLF